MGAKGRGGRWFRGISRSFFFLRRAPKNGHCFSRGRWPGRSRSPGSWHKSQRTFCTCGLPHTIPARSWRLHGCRKSHRISNIFRLKTFLVSSLSFSSLFLSVAENKVRHHNRSILCLSVSQEFGPLYSAIPAPIRERGFCRPFN